MKEFKGTPGSWVKETRGSKILAIIPKKYGERVLETVLQTGTICEDDCGNEKCCCIEEHANANLIAAAPDLLECLQQMVYHFEREKQSKSAYTVCAAAHHAINKAIK